MKNLKITPSPSKNRTVPLNNCTSHSQPSKSLNPPNNLVVLDFIEKPTPLSPNPTAFCVKPAIRKSFQHFFLSLTSTKRRSLIIKCPQAHTPSSPVVLLPLNILIANLLLSSYCSCLFIILFNFCVYLVRNRYFCVKRSFFLVSVSKHIEECRHSILYLLVKIHVSLFFCILRNLFLFFSPLFTIVFLSILLSFLY
ncbi:uncharacterized protein BYT42DRAFT_557876 [Radiomyces spectabilis]|uniref:uncharacterized protein n=1 Tax=Radiomyces spectabilis TaxID=64574 RepID=UPI00221F82B2|nr:uncharacterized protein BYT42DRAFT_557876 [Radiomyces spectabilis]KAI8391738.1 hypothetical protein BYT42DRAFT_557876 [Radiomyces spectabilis]